MIPTGLLHGYCRGGDCWARTPTRSQLAKQALSIERVPQNGIEFSCRESFRYNKIGGRLLLTAGTNGDDCCAGGYFACRSDECGQRSGGASTFTEDDVDVDEAKSSESLFVALGFEDGEG